MSSWLRFVIIFVPVLLAVGLLHAFVYRRTVQAFRPRRWMKAAMVAVLVSGPLALVSGRLLARGELVGGGIYDPITVYGSIVTIGALLTAAVLLPVAFAEQIGAFIARLRRRWAASPSLAPSPIEEPAPVNARTEGALTLPRRRFLSQVTTGGALFVAGGSSVYGGLFGRHDYQLEEIPIVLRGLPRSLDGYTIVQLSDLHIGSFVGEPELRAAIALARQARPDLIVLTGDLLDHDAAFAPKLGAFVRRLEGLGRDGVAAIPGNHDHYAGLDATLGALRGGGADVLMNEGRVIGDDGGRFALLGVDDVWARRHGAGPDLDRAFAAVPRDLASVLLCHNPEFFLESADRVGLQLSGHTHGGQVNFGVNSAELVFRHGYVRGHYRRDGGQIYVNRGFGTAGPPSRIGSAPEVTKIVLVAG